MNDPSSPESPLPDRPSSEGGATREGADAAGHGGQAPEVLSAAEEGRGRRRRGRRPQRKRTPWYNRPATQKIGLALVIVVGVALLADKGWDYARWRDSQTWVAVEGEVVRIAQIKQRPGRKMPSGGFGGPRQPKESFATIFYTYTAADGVERRGSKVSYAISGESVPVDWLPELPREGPATIYVHPESPTLSVLRKGDEFEFWSIRVAIALFMIFAGAVRLLYAVMAW